LGVSGGGAEEGAVKKSVRRTEKNDDRNLGGLEEKSGLGEKKRRAGEVMVDQMKDCGGGSGFLFRIRRMLMTVIDCRKWFLGLKEPDLGACSCVLKLNQGKMVGGGSKQSFWYLAAFGVGGGHRCFRGGESFVWGRLIK